MRYWPRRSSSSCRKARAKLYGAGRSEGSRAPHFLQNNFADHVGAANLRSSSVRATGAGCSQGSKRSSCMRFMMLMIPLGYEAAPPDVKLDPERVVTMMRYKEALPDHGVLLTRGGLQAP